MKITSNYGKSSPFLFLEGGEAFWTVCNTDGRNVKLCGSVVLFGSKEAADSACEAGEHSVIHMVSLRGLK